MDAATPDQQPLSAEQPETPAPEGDNKVKRVNKACLNCRKRKSRCHLDEGGQVPCLRCKREDLECILGGSNRGGRRIRRKTIDPQVGPSSYPTIYTHTQEEVEESAYGQLSAATAWATHPLPTQSPTQLRPQLPDLNSESRYRELQPPEIDRSRSLSSEQLSFPKLQNPSDALGILAQVAETSTNNDERRMQLSNGRHAPSVLNDSRQNSGMRYPPIDEGHISLHQVEWLVRRYYENYHPYYPLAPIDSLNVSRLVEVAANEPHLLTAVLVIASKDLVDQPNIYEACARYMKSLVSDLAAGGDGGLEAVEALLILAEWAPYTQRSDSERVGRGEEDKEAWMHIGVALRISYFLGLDRFSFRIPDEGKDPQFNRKRLIWTACYMSDRQISIRIGKGFWSRGPGPLTSLRREDHVPLLPRTTNEEDYASIFQATLELTTLSSNVHDVLYANPGSSLRSHLSGGYIKFIDDFRNAIYTWKSVWGTLTCSSHLKATLTMSYHYLRLYTVAFAFHATVRREQELRKKNTPQYSTQYQAPSRLFYKNVAKVTDVRFIYEGLEAAKEIISTLNSYVDAQRSLRFMPLRIYLYLVYAGVFLYRARCVGVMEDEEDKAVRHMVQETISKLEKAGMGPLHPGSRYSQLLKLLWQKVGTKERIRHPNVPNPSSFRPGDTPASVLSQDNHSMVGSSPAVTEQMGDFAWTDLMAVGDFAVNGYNAAGTQAGDDNLLGFLPMDMGNAWDIGHFDFDSSTGLAF
ncbi:hypothetical protein EJ05DRAFT_509914 [Pseudovirgaria hyperparasitica]|uniref:Zn(2)-C6 fungal-type domain-containing protein n=1 Tax=Pseudovirgaria hyperparasitica TaxID=470096 RepID=A0A6A6W915_9PEZI|nr:uncharacterized protein EJ05DRAFT_509914 [Pseudovirgaria hyperparasitica]KAF2759045.1 hypothetical protein EJ05DRAFT_509914 [Pseudovirgaria hyperparasitica]